MMSNLSAHVRSYVECNNITRFTIVQSLGSATGVVKPVLAWKVYGPSLCPYNGVAINFINWTICTVSYIMIYIMPSNSFFSSNIYQEKLTPGIEQFWNPFFMSLLSEVSLMDDLFDPMKQSFTRSIRCLSASTTITAPTKRYLRNQRANKMQL